jgi:integrase/recombinase XerD
VTGRRNFAMITMLSRLGLRAGETAALLVSDIDWRRGELVVRGKANRFSRLPLPVDVGEAVVAWLQHWRPHGGCRHVFTRLRAPVGPLSNAGVSMVAASSRWRSSCGTVVSALQRSTPESIATGHGPRRSRQHSTHCAD